MIHNDTLKYFIIVVSKVCKYLRQISLSLGGQCSANMVAIVYGGATPSATTVHR